ncbi:hypothetical protein FB567DRAFT_19292 [Paraphoma chrysanthemicola]|uniref:Uncharacterized protein n=1 Tax=Paraphoma chrysanthemicola TaxID=798071 RepID=A0A8K0RFC3_9PLEO|nr:hypothetical protein FB567DRAFT_19292 [Paraphoma chrysanthemicola]
MLLTLILWTLSFLPFLAAMPTTPGPLQKRCTNVLQNPSFESGIDPWLAMAFGSWAQRGVYTSASGGHEGRNFYFGRSNATVASSSLNLSQSGLKIPAGTTVDCSTWVATDRPGNVGNTHVELFVDEQSCGGVYLGTTGWTKVGGKVMVSGDSHTFSIIAVSSETGPEGGAIWVDDAVLGTNC